MRRIKAQLAFLGVRQNAMGRDLGIEVCRLNKIINGWVKGTADEVRKIKLYLQDRRGKPGASLARRPTRALQQQSAGK